MNQDKINSAVQLHWADGLLLLVALFWGTNFAAVKFGLAEITPLIFNALRYVIAVIVMFIFVLISQQKISIQRKHWLYLIVVGVLGNSGYPLFFIFGLDNTSADNSAMIMSTMPAWVALFGTFIGMERLNQRGWIGVGLSVFGIVLVILGGNEHIDLRFGGASLYGDLLILAALLCWSLYTLALRPLTRVYPPAVVSTLAMAVGILPMVLFAGPAFSQFTWHGISTAAWLSLLVTGIFAVGLAYIFWGFGVAHLGGTRTSLYLNAVPPIALLANWLLLGETLTSIQWIGTAIALIGVALARRSTATVSGGWFETWLKIY